MGIADELQKLQQLRHNGTLTDQEFAQAKSQLLANPPVESPQLTPFIEDQLKAVRHQNELTRIDREWEIERRQFQMQGRYGRVFTPTIGMGIATAVFGGIFGAFWTVIAFTITNASTSMLPGMGPGIGLFGIIGTVFPLIGVVFTVGAIGRGIYCVIQAQRYNEAYSAYKERHIRVAAGQDSA